MRKRMRKISIFLLFALMFGLLTACADNNQPAETATEETATEETATEETATEQPATETDAETVEDETPPPVATDNGDAIVVRMLTRWSGDQPREVAFRDWIDAFNAENTHIQIDAVHISDEPTLLDRIRTSFATGDQPNLFWEYGGARTIEYVRNGMLMDLQPVLDADPEWSNMFLPLFDKWIYEDYPGLFGMPFEFYAIALFYNEDIFAEAGLEPPRSIEEFEYVSERFLEMGIVPMPLGVRDPWRGGHLFNNLVMKTWGADAIERLASRELAYDSPEIINILETMQDFGERGFFGSDPIAEDVNWEEMMFGTGQAAMLQMGSWLLGSMAHMEIADSIGVVPFPYVNPAFRDSWFGSAAGFSVTVQNDPAERDATIEVLKYIYSREFFEKVWEAEQGGLLPIRLEYLRNAAEVEVSPISLKFIDVVAGAAYFRDDVQTYDPLPGMLDFVRNAFQGLFVGESPESVARSIVDEINARE